MRCRAVRRVVSAAAAAAVAAAAAPWRPQLSLAPCDTAATAFLRPHASLGWNFTGNETTGAPGTFVLTSTGQCVTYDPPTTNLVMDACSSAAAALQTFAIRADGTFYAPTQGTCFDVQYYGNVTGSVLGLYECHAEQAWGVFAYSRAARRITNAQRETLCVNGAGAPAPLPSAEQLAWTRREVALMISYDMITQLPDVPNPQHFCIDAGGDAGFAVPPATAFAPAALNASNWVAAAAAVGAGYTLLVASHCSGFLQWQSNVTLPDGSPYPYTVRQATGWRGGRGDVVADYVAASTAAAMPFGFYLTVNYNYLFNWGPRGFAPGPLAPGQIRVTAAEYAAVMLATVEEVWARYPGALTELWFDGGENGAAMNALIARLQPQAIATDGTQLPNVARLVGSETGFAPYPVWSTAHYAAVDGSGDVDGRVFVPAEADTPIAASDAWFWKPGQRLRPLAELKAVYRNTVGANAVLELGVLPDDTGNVPPDQASLLAELGAYIRTCHSPAAALAAAAGTAAALSVTLSPPAIVDRVVLQEDLAFGQLVRAFTVTVQPPGAPAPIVVGAGTAVGHKRILYFEGGGVPAARLTVTATELYPGVAEAHWRNVAVYAPCAAE